MTALTQDIDRACARIAPTWPLDQFIAVNPYWGWVDQPMPQAAAALEALGGIAPDLPRSWFAAQWQAAICSVGICRRRQSVPQATPQRQTVGSSR